MLHLSYDELFALTHFQFKQLFRGWQEREKLDAIKRAQIISTLHNVNRWDKEQELVTIEDLLPWYNDYVEGHGGSEYYAQRREAFVPQPISIDIDPEELLLQTTRSLLEQWGDDPDAVSHDSDKWRNAELVARDCCGFNLDKEGGIVVGDGVVIYKADSSVWGPEGKPPWEIEDDRKKVKT